MARNGAGAYSLPAGNPVVTGTVISSTTHNNTMSDIASEITNSTDKDGQTVITGTWDFNANEIILDLDGDTSITADTDDQIDIKIAGADDFRFTANTFTALTGSSVVVDTMTVATGSITDSSGAISFGNENLSTTGTLASGALTSGDITIQTTAPTLKWLETNGPVNENIWRQEANLGVFNFYALNDAESSARSILQVDRTAQAIDTITYGNATDNPAHSMLGNLSVTGNQTISGYVYKSVTNSITAGSTQTQAGATALTTDINRVTVSGTNGDGVKLPTAVAGSEILIINDDAAQTIQIWPNTSDAIDGGAADAVDSNALAAGVSRRYIAVDATTWYTA